MSNERFMELMTKKTAGEATVAELAELETLLQADKMLADRYAILNKYLAEPGYNVSANKETALQRTLTKINQANGEEKMPEDIVPVMTIHSNSKPKIPVWKWASAAAAMLIIAISILSIKKNSESILLTDRLVEKQNGKGIKSTIVLTDGSKIWLNADSKISYPEVFNDNVREVTLDGEAFFDVAKNPAKPFIIHLANGTVRVLGTSFNIRAYANEKTIETSVATGRVAFIPKYSGGDKKQDTIFLTPESKARFLPEKNEVTTQATISADDKAWTEGKMIFRSMLFNEIGAELERGFGKQVVFTDESLKDYRLTGSFQNNTLSEILYYLSKTKTFSYQISDEQIIISK